MFRENTMFTLRSQAKILNNNQVTVVTVKSETPETIDDGLEQLKTCMDLLSTASRTLQQCLSRNDCGQCGLLERIEDLKRQAIMDRRSSNNCSLLSRMAERSDDFNTDLKKIELLADNAKGLIQHISWQIQDVVNLVKIAKQIVDNDIKKLTFDKSDQDRRYGLFDERRSRLLEEIKQLF